MEYTISYFTLGAIALNIILGVVVPSFLFAYCKKKFHCSSRPFWTGLVTVLFFVYFLESLAHGFILPTAFGQKISGNLFLSAVYGAVMAVIFQEGGKCFAFWKLLPKEDENDDRDVLMYAAGHASFEWMYGLIFGMMGNLMIVRTILSGNAELLLYGLEGEELESVAQSLRALCNVSPLSFLMAPFERVVALILQGSISVFLWFGLQRGKKGISLVAQALGIRFAVEFAAGVLGEKMPMFQLELIMLAVSVFIASFAYKTWQKEAFVWENPEE